MKFLLILVPLTTYGLFVSVQPEEGDVRNETAFESVDRTFAVQQQEALIEQEFEVLAEPPFDAAESGDSTDNIILSEFASEELLHDERFDFPEREFPDAPEYYRSPNAPE